MIGSIHLMYKQLTPTLVGWTWRFFATCVSDIISFLSPEQALNESASQLFRSGEETEVVEGVAIMNEAIIPCLHLMSRDATLAPEDADVMETIRDHWCTCLSPDMDGEGGGVCNRTRPVRSGWDRSDYTYLHYQYLVVEWRTLSILTSHFQKGHTTVYLLDCLNYKHLVTCFGR